MRRHHHAVQREERRVGGGLVREHVERGTAQMSALDRLGQGVLVDDAAPRRVHQASALLHQPELVLAQQSLGLGGSRQMDRHEVGLDQERLERRHRIDAHLLRTLGADVGIERDHPHAEPGRALGHQRAHPSQPDEADRLAGELHALPLRALPRALFQRGVGLRGVASLRQEQGHRLLGGADDVGLRRVDHHDAAARGGFDVDVVQADPRARHHLQLWRGGEHLVGDLRGAADDERVVGRDLGREVAPGEVGANVHLEVLAEQLQPLLGELLGDEDPHEARDSMKTVSAAATAAPRFTG